MQIVVVGAGFAGLGAARTLVDLGVDVLVLEAEERAGGRARPITIDGRDVSTGASWLHGINDNALLPLARRAGVPLLPSDDEDYTVHRAKGPLNDAEYELADDFEQTLFGALERAPAGSSVATVVERLRARFDAAWGSATTDYWVRGMIDEEFTADPSDLDVVTTQEGADPGGGDLLLPEGFGRLIDDLADRLDIHYGERVEQIDRGRATGVRTATTRYATDGVIVTVPLDVPIRYEPELPEAHRLARASLSMGRAAKIFLTFDEPFWPSSVIGLTAPENPWVNYYDVSARGRPTLMGFACGRDVDKIGNHDDEVIDDACRALKVVAGRIPQPRAGKIVRWSGDGRSAYSYVRVGGRPDARVMLAQPVEPTLVFAGEATSERYPATTHGAYLSGVEAAKRLVDLR